MRALLILYPLATLFCIIVTANHYWLDGAGGLVALGAGLLFGHLIHEWNQRRLERRYGPLPASGPADDVPADEIPAGPTGNALDADAIGAGEIDHRAVDAQNEW